MDVRLIGDKLHRKTGENNCLILMSELLRERGFKCEICYKLSLAALRPADTIILSPGGGRFTLIVELCILLVHLMRRPKIFIWYHNSSFARWKYPVRILQKLGDITELCLTKREARARPHAVYFPNSVPANSNRAAKRKKLVWLSRIEQAKGIQAAWEAYRVLHAKDNTWSFDVIGPAGDWEIPSEPPVTQHGSQWGNEKFELLSRGGIFVLPSKYRQEKQPLVLLEALSVGLPTVLSIHNGIEELIFNEEARAGLSVDTLAAPAVYAAAIEQVYDDWEQYHRGALKLAEEEYSREAFCSRVDELFGRRP